MACIVYKLMKFLLLYNLSQINPCTSSIRLPSPEILTYLRRFGYLEKNPNDSEALYHELAIMEAIKNVQKYGAVEETGQLDDETYQLFHKPRCGVPDLINNQKESSFMGRRNKRFIFGARTWSKRNINYYIENRSLKIPYKQIERDVERAIAVWSRFSGLKFKRIYNTSADIIVRFGTGYHGDHFPFDGPGNILAHAFYPYEMNEWGGDVHFDDDENWQENAVDLREGVDFYSVALHELGHCLGLAHTPNYNSIMFPYYKGPQHNGLDYDDIMAMYTAYLNRKLEDDLNHFESKKLETDEFKRDLSADINDNKIYNDATNEATTLRSLSSHENQNKNNRTVRINSAELANICDGHFNAVCYFNGSMHIFKASYIWKLTNNYRIAPGYPRSLNEIFFNLPKYVKHIDACYERYDKEIVLFRDQAVWFLRNNIITNNSPQSLESIIQNPPLRINAAILWPKNNLTYIFGNTTFWRYNDQHQLMDNGYPKSIKRWPGVPENLDAAATLPNGKTYFFKDNMYWLYNNILLRPMSGYPRTASVAWLGCAEKSIQLN